MGSYRFAVGAVTQNGAWTITGGTLLGILSGTDAHTVDETFVDQAICLGSPFVNAPDAGTYELDCIPEDLIQLDGNPGVDINNLPVGFNANSATIKLRIALNNWSSPNVILAKIVYDGTILNTFTNHGSTVGPIDLDNFGTVSSLLALFSAHWLIHIELVQGKTAATVCGNLPYNDSDNPITHFYLEGQYSIITGITLLDEGGTIQSGDTITIDSDGVGPNDLTDIDHVEVTYTDTNGDIQHVIIPNTDFIIWITIQITFVFDFPPDADKTFPWVFCIVGTQFTGSVMLGKLTAIIANGSGIYKLTNGKDNDTCYQNSSSGNTTVDVAIPNPFVETGFIGG